MLSLLLLVWGFVLPEGAVFEEAVSGQEARRAAVPLRVRAVGTISSIVPARATVSLSPSFGADAVRIGQAASIQVRPPALLRGKVTRMVRSCATGAVAAEIALDEPLPAEVSVGTRVGALIDVGDPHDVLLLTAAEFGRP